MALDLLVTNATLPDGRSDMSVAVREGRIVEVTAGLVQLERDAGCARKLQPSRTQP